MLKGYSSRSVCVSVCYQAIYTYVPHLQVKVQCYKVRCGIVNFAENALLASFVICVLTFPS